MADRASETEAIDLVVVTTEIVAAYVGHNALSRSDLSGVISAVHAALSELGSPAEPAIVQQAPSVSIRKSLSEESLTCLECGKRFKSIKRHLRTSHGLSPDDYRAKWALPKDYPMVAPAYSSKRSELAKINGLGLKAAAARKRRR